MNKAGYQSIASTIQQFQTVQDDEQDALKKPEIFANNLQQNWRTAPDNVSGIYQWKTD